MDPQSIDSRRTACLSEGRCPEGTSPRGNAAPGLPGPPRPEDTPTERSQRDIGCFDREVSGRKEHTIRVEDPRGHPGAERWLPAYVDLTSKYPRRSFPPTATEGASSGDPHTGRAQRLKLVANRSGSHSAGRRNNPDIPNPDRWSAADTKQERQAPVAVGESGAQALPVADPAGAGPGPRARGPGPGGTRCNGSGSSRAAS